MRLQTSRKTNKKNNIFKNENRNKCEISNVLFKFKLFYEHCDKPRIVHDYLGNMLRMLGV